MVEGLECRTLMSDTVLQAESALVSGAAVSRQQAGYTGSGYVDFVNASGDFVEFNVSVPSDGFYHLNFRYANGSATARGMELKVGQFPAPSPSFGPTGSWTNWQTMTSSNFLRAGNTVVRLTATGQSGPNVDALTVSPTPPTTTGAQVFQAESMRVVQGTRFSRSQPGYTGFGYVDFPGVNFDVIEFTTAVPSAGVYRLDFRYANGSGQFRDLTVNVNGGGGENQQVYFAPTGSASTWRTASLEMYLDGGSHFMIGPRAGRGPSLDSVTITPTGSTTRTIQAESAFGLPRSTGASGYTGTGFADFSDRAGERLTFWPAGNGDYDFEFRYANGGSTSRPLLLRQGFAAPQFQQYLQFAPTGSWSTWKTERVRVHLSPTTTPIELQSIGYGGPNIDSLTIRPAAPLPPDDDRDDTLTSAPFTPIGRSAAFFEGSGTSQLDSPTDVDLTRFEARAGQRVIFRYSSAGDFRLRLFDAAGRELAATTARGFQPFPNDVAMEYTFAGAATYYLGVSAAANDSYDPVTGQGDRPGQTTGYGVTLYDHGKRPPAPAGPDNDDQFSEARTMSRTDAQTIDDSISSSTDVDLYHFITAPAGGPFLTISNRDVGASDLLVRIFDAYGRELARLRGDTLVVPDDLIGTAPGRFNSDEALFPLFGDYYIGVSAAANGSYNPLTGGNDAAGGAAARYRLTWALQRPDTGGRGGGD